MGKKYRLVFKLIFVMVLCWISFALPVYGGEYWVLVNDTGNQTSSWARLEYGMESVNSLSDGPSSGNGGSFYYFIDTIYSGDKRHVAYARVARSVDLTGNQRILGELGQLRANFSLDYHGCSDNPDWFRIYLFAQKGDGSWTNIWSSGNYSGVKGWKTLSVNNVQLPAGTKALKIDIYADRKGGKDLDVYLDNIKLNVHDDFPPVMSDVIVKEIRDYSGKVIPLNKDKEGEYLDNWVNPSDIIFLTAKFNEPVKGTGLDNIYTNLLKVDGKDFIPSFNMGKDNKDTHEFGIPLAGAVKLKAGEDNIKLFYNPEGFISDSPFLSPIYDLGGNLAAFASKPNIDKYKLKLDSVSPDIIWPTWEDNPYELYEIGRTSVDIIVQEENKGVEQSPLTLTYHWEYKDAKGSMVKEKEKKLAVDSSLAPIIDEYNTTYTVNIDIPNGDNIPPYQKFKLYAEISDEARNWGGDHYLEIEVNQKDETPADIIWDKSVHEDGTIIDLTENPTPPVATSSVYKFGAIAGFTEKEDTAYTTSRIVSFTAEDEESEIEEVKYSWTKDPYDGDKATINKVVLPKEEDGKYYVAGTKEDTPLEGIYYLNIIAINGTETAAVSSKAFYFDNEGPRVGDKIVYKDESFKEPDFIEYNLTDRALHNKFLYTLLVTYEDEWTFELVTEPDISEGIVDNGMWKALDVESIVDNEGIAKIRGIFEGISETGFYKVVARFYDEYLNWTQIESYINFDFEPPTLNVIELGEPGVFKKRHEVIYKNMPHILFPGVLIEVKDNMSHINILDEESFSACWIDVNTGERVPASCEDGQGWAVVKGSDELSGRYYLHVKAIDFAGNIMDEKVYKDGNPVEFCFDNSPPTVDVSYDRYSGEDLFKFSYRNLIDAYTEVSLFQYGISEAEGEEPLAWIDIDFSANEGIINALFAHDGTWYWHIRLWDTLGNESIEVYPFTIDKTSPTGCITITEEFTNKVNVALHLKADELVGIPNKTFKTILSDDLAKLSDDVIGDAQPTDWKDITYEDGEAIYNWAFPETADGEQKVYVRFMDEAGNISYIYEASIRLYRTSPTGSIDYDITEPTGGIVKATLTIDDGLILLNNNGDKTYEFNRNGEFEFIFADAAGNMGRAKAVVNNIDKEPPKAYIEYDHPIDIWTNESITARLYLEDINGYEVLSQGGDTHTFSDNGEFIFEFKDSLGNLGSIKAEVKNIDKRPPEGYINYSYSDTAPVAVYLMADEAVKVTNNGGSLRYEFLENGEFTFEFEDKAGNKGTAAASVYTIIHENYVNVVYDDAGTPTNKDVTAVFIPNPALACLTSPTVEDDSFDAYKYKFTDNKSHTVYIKALSGEGDRKTVTAYVYNIDKIPPQADFYISETEFTNQNVIVNLLPYDDKGTDIKILNNNGNAEYIFEDNGSFIFEFSDEAGNIVTEEITITNIDKKAPKAEINYYKEEDKPNSKFAKVVFTGELEEVIILNNNGTDVFEFVENGAFTFLYADTAGNKGEITAIVSDLSDTAPAGVMEYYIGDIKVDNIDEIKTNESVRAKLILAEGNSPYRIINNEGKDNYTFSQNGEFTFIYMDENQRKGFAAAKVKSIDKEPPKVQIYADIVEPTKEDVIISVSYSDNVEIAEVLHNMESSNMTIKDNKITYICRENKLIEITVIDTAGNETKKIYNVNYIFRENPKGEISYTPDKITNKNVRALLAIDRPAKILNNSGKTEYIFTQNGEFTFLFEDMAGNKGEATAIVTWIDKIPPTGTVTYSKMDMTNKPVIASLRTSEDAMVLNNGGSQNRIFNTNGEFIWKIGDKAGNIIEITARVANIDSDKPEIKLKGPSYIAIFQNEDYVEEGYSATDNIDGDITDKVEITGSVNTDEPGIYYLKYKATDAVGNESDVIRTIKVLSPGELVILINSKATEGESIILDDTNVSAAVIGNEGDYSLQYAKGKKTKAYFKTDGVIVDGDSAIKLEAYNWYTFYVEDSERRTKTIMIYINK